MHTTPPCTIRPLDAKDEDFVLDSFLHSYRQSIDVQSVPNQLYFEGARKLFSRVFMQAEFRVACDPEDENEIYGWIAFTPLSDTFTLVYWTHVKIMFRRFGIATRLLEPIAHTRILYPFRSRDTVWVREKGLATFNPFIIHEVLK